MIFIGSWQSYATDEKQNKRSVLVKKKGEKMRVSVCGTIVRMCVIKNDFLEKMQL